MLPPRPAFSERFISFSAALDAAYGGWFTIEHFNFRPFPPLGILAVDDCGRNELCTYLMNQAKNRQENNYHLRRA
jgi:hypothetical protein